MKLAIFFYRAKTEDLPSDRYVMDESTVTLLSAVTLNWLKFNPDGYVRVEVLNS